MFGLSFVYLRASRRRRLRIRFIYFRTSYRQTLCAHVARQSANFVRAFRGLQSGGSSSRANEPRPQKHSRGRDPLAPAGPESSRDAHGRSWGRVWISTRGSPRYARGRARMCDSATTRRPNARCARLSPRRVRICGDPEEAPRTRHSARARAVARRRRASALSRNARTSVVNASR